MQLICAGKDVMVSTLEAISPPPLQNKTPKKKKKKQVDAGGEH